MTVNLVDVLKYTSFIYSINKKFIDEPTNETKATFLFGFLEETEEFLQADEGTEELSELGDMLAYLCLILLLHKSVGETAHYLSKFTLKEAPSDLEILSNLKRVFRKDEAINLDLITARFFEYALTYENHTLNEVMAYNINKLSKRVQNNTLTKGRGEDR
jgi:NTP pyrophosphatase (non-canonical NTP hydrolase)